MPLSDLGVHGGCCDFQIATGGNSGSCVRQSQLLRLVKGFVVDNFGCQPWGQRDIAREWCLKPWNIQIFVHVALRMLKKWHISMVIRLNVFSRNCAQTISAHWLDSTCSYQHSKPWNMIIIVASRANKRHIIIMYLYRRFADMRAGSLYAYMHVADCSYFGKPVSICCWGILGCWMHSSEQATV